MSYDLMVFEPDAAPRNRADFMKWYVELTEWTEGHDYDDPQFTSPRVRAWYRDMVLDFPAMNGPDGVQDDEVDNPKVTDYCLARQAAYMGFAWSEAEPAYKVCKRLAFEHGLGFFDPQSEDAGIFFPDLPNGGRLNATGSWLGRLLGG